MTVDVAALTLTLRLAASTTAILLVIGLPLAHWLATSSWKGKFFVEAIATLPLVLPPTVIGFYILMATGPESPAGRLFESLTGDRLPFSFAGILVGSVIFNFPFAVRPFTAAFATIDRRLVEASWCLGVSRTKTFYRVTLPLQEYALFPHLTVAGNIGFSLSGLLRAERHRRVAEMVDLFGLEGLENRYPRQISGGQQQRVALARVLVRRPRLLLLDEPLAALDALLREQVRADMRRVLAGFDIPVILVTHDRTETFALADQVIILHEGRTVQKGKVQEVFARPANVNVARIVGTDNVEPGRVLRSAEGLAIIAIGQNELVAPAPEKPATEVMVCIRGEEIILQNQAGVHANDDRTDCQSVPHRNRLQATVHALTPEGPLMRVELDCGFRLIALITRPVSEELGLCLGKIVWALVKASAVHLIPRG